MAYSRGSSSNIIVGAAALFTHNAGPIGYDSADGKITDEQALVDLPAMTASSTSYKETLSNDSAYTNVGYTSNGLELAFQPDFGEVAVDQLLDVARLFKQGMTVNLNTSFAEATLGADISVPTLDGDEVTVRIAPGTPSGRTLRVKGRGVKKGLNAGDLMITLDVAIPQRVDGAAKKAIEDFSKATKGFDPRAEFFRKAKL